MGIYHCSVKIISRSAGRSATAAAAYRAAEIILDERTGLVHDYTRKKGVLATEILSPSGQPVPDWVFDRERLWNEAELAEKRINSRVAREFEIALPHELDDDARHQVTREFAQFLSDRYQTAVDIALHAPDRDSDQRNHHAHILMSTRQIEPEGFEAKTRVLDSLHAGPLEIETIRAQWAYCLNRAYLRAGLDVELDHRSYERQGIDQEPTKHLGPDAHEIEMTGRNSELGDHNRAVQNGSRSTLEFAVLSPAERKIIVTDLYQQSDTGKALEAALFEHGFILARGDKRDFVIVEQNGAEHSLARCVNGVRIKQIREKCADLNRLQLSSISGAHDLWREHDREIEAVMKLQEAREAKEEGAEYDREQEETRSQTKYTETPKQPEPEQAEPEQPSPEKSAPPAQENPEEGAGPAPDWSREEEEAERLRKEEEIEVSRIAKAKAELELEFERRQTVLNQSHNLRRDQKQHAWLGDKDAAMREFDKELDVWRKTEQAKYVTCTGDVLEKHEKVKEVWDRTLCRLNVQNFKRRARKEKNRETYINSLAMRRRSGYSKSLEDKYAKEMKTLAEQDRVELRVLAGEHKIEERNLDTLLKEQQDQQQKQEQATKQQTEQPEQEPREPELETPTLDKLLTGQQERRGRLEDDWRKDQAEHKQTRTQHWRDWKRDQLDTFDNLFELAEGGKDYDQPLKEFYKDIRLDVPSGRKILHAQARQMVEKQVNRIANKELKKEQKQHGRDFFANRDKLRKLELKERLNLADRAGDDTQAQAARESAMKKQREIEREEALRLRRMRESTRDERDRDDR